MRTLRFSILAFLLGLALSPLVSAANPELKAQERGINDPARASKALRLALLNLEVDLVGALADVTMTAHFANPSNQTLEGDFSLELPEGAVVTGYALDIEGRMIDGVLLDPLKAKRTYQNVVRRGIDPGIANVSHANVFSTRVFPIPARGVRFIRVKFSAPIHAVRGLTLPLATQQPVGSFMLKLQSSATAERPEVTLPNKLAAEWQSAEGASLSARLSDTALSGELRIAPVKPKYEAQTSRHANGRRMVHILEFPTRIEETRSTGRSLRVYWDRSLSRRDQKLADERALLAKYLEQAQPRSVDLVMFNSSGARVQRVKASELDTALRGTLYRGATSFAVLEKLDAPAAEVCLVFSDGLVTMDTRSKFAPDCEIFAITSAADADEGFLQRLTRGAAGAVLHLRTQAPAEILARLKGGGPRVLKATAEDGKALRFVALESGPASYSVVTEAPVTGAVVLTVAGLGGEPVERRYTPASPRAASFNGAGALWAAGQVAWLAADDEAHKAMVSLSRRFSVASPSMSFLVLEQAQDYLEAGIAPPPSFSKDWLEAYRELKAEYEAERRAAEAERLEEVLAGWNGVVDWWGQDFKPASQKKIASGELLPSAPPMPEISADVMEFSPPAPAMAMASRGEAGNLEDVAVTGMRGEMNSPMEARRSIDIKVAEWNVTRPYITALNAAAPGDVDRVLAAQERKHGTSPAFYFDVAEWLYRKQRAADALEMLLSALDLPVANEETSSMVADRLQRYGKVDRAIWLLERAARQTDYLPQPRRALALALARRAEQGGTRSRADLQRAAKLLNEVIMTPWQGSYDGIELVSLMEVNNLLPRLRALGVEKMPLDERLIKQLDVDLRVVIEWNTGASDMDLWVDEPSGERSIYSNPLTEIGGRLSNDMTQGYGPEEYLLRRAPDGEYRISVNVYASDVINPNGSTVVTARMFRDWGRPTQKEQTLELELEPNDRGEKLIGTFVVK